jgi:glucose-1-phosphate thymidylyltransferase
MLAGIREILVISTPSDLPRFRDLLGDGSQWGLQIEFGLQPEPRGLAEAFIIGREFVGTDCVCLILGDNIFFGDKLRNRLRNATKLRAGCRVFGYRVRDPERYGVIAFDRLGRPTSLEEKPEDPQSSYAVTGLYFYDNSVLDHARRLEPSARGELEITDLNRIYLESGTLELELLGRGVAWLDTGTHESMLRAANFIETVERRQGLKIACLEEIAFRQGWITLEQLGDSIDSVKNSAYGEYLQEFRQEYLLGIGALRDRFGVSEATDSTERS